MFSIDFQSADHFLSFLPPFSVARIPTSNFNNAKYYQLAEGPSEIICTAINEADQEAFTMTKETVESNSDTKDQRLLFSIHYFNFETSFRFRYDMNYLCPNRRLASPSRLRSQHVLQLHQANPVRRMR